MATTTTNTTQLPQRRPFNLVRCVSVFLLALIVLVGLAVLITWLAIRPKRLVYTIEEGSVQNFNLSNNHLNASFSFQIRAHNRNSKISIYYDSIEASVAYEDQTVAFVSIDPFYQSHRNVTRLDTKLVAQNVALSGSNSRDLRLEKTSGEIELEVNVKARIRFKVGVWKSNHRTLRLSCSPVMLHLSPSKHFQMTPCESEL